MSKPKLTYFKIGSRGAAIRWAFVLGGLEFEEELTDKDSFQKVKQNTDSYPYTSVPVLNVNGTVIAQSNTILRYVGKQANLYSNDPVEAMKIDEIMDAVEDLFSHFVTYNREPNPEKKKELLLKMEKETYPRWFTLLENRIRLFGKDGHAVSDHFTVADLKITGTFNRLFNFLPKTLLDEHPLIKAIIDKVNQNPKIKEYEENLQKKLSNY